jgi:hypothetical protein
MRRCLWQFDTFVEDEGSEGEEEGGGVADAGNDDDDSDSSSDEESARQDMLRLNRSPAARSAIPPPAPTRAVARTPLRAAAPPPVPDAAAIQAAQAAAVRSSRQRALEARISHLETACRKERTRLQDLEGALDLNSQEQVWNLAHTTSKHIS